MLLLFCVLMSHASHASSHCAALDDLFDCDSNPPFLALSLALFLMWYLKQHSHFFRLSVFAQLAALHLFQLVSCHAGPFLMLAVGFFRCLMPFPLRHLGCFGSFRFWDFSALADIKHEFSPRGDVSLAGERGIHSFSIHYQLLILHCSL